MFEFGFSVLNLSVCLKMDFEVGLEVWILGMVYGFGLGLDISFGLNFFLSFVFMFEFVFGSSVLGFNWFEIYILGFGFGF